ncbi:MAG: tRNA pseudouridine(55) synthase TruB [Clostridiales bacterium 38-18]|nr:MAG: tRNA pseudouridine(55) synthase TruB [Clostridiales bacterium 38-18]
MNGVIVIDKPQNMTSHDVVAIMRKRLNTKKIGHTGTLDPMATGVLPICIGRATKIVDYLTERRKAYSCEMQLGSATDTQDAWGEVIEQFDGEYPDAIRIKEVVLSFLGDIDQIPPMYSALKVGGEKLVDLARKGIVVEREARRRTIYSIENLEVRHHTISFDVTCSKGTYVRTLCHDIGMRLGTYGHMTSLRRTISEPFSLDTAISIEDVTVESVTSALVEIEAALSFMPKVELVGNPKMIELLNNGVKLDLNNRLSLSLDDGFYRIFIDDIFWGIGEAEAQKLILSKNMKV